MKVTITVHFYTFIGLKTLLHKLLQTLINMPIKDKDIETGGGINITKIEKKYGKLNFDLDPEN